MKQRIGSPKVSQQIFCKCPRGFRRQPLCGRTVQVDLSRDISSSSTALSTTHGFFLTQLLPSLYPANTARRGRMPTIQRTTIDLILGAVTNHAGEDGLMHSFLFSHDPNLPSLRSNLGATIFFSQRSMVRAALFVRSHGPIYIRSLSIDDIRTMLQDFLKEHFTLIARETLFHRFPGNYAKKVSDTTKTLLARALADSEIFSPVNALGITKKG